MSISLFDAVKLIKMYLLCRNACLKKFIHNVVVGVKKLIPLCRKIVFSCKIGQFHTKQLRIQSTPIFRRFFAVVVSLVPLCET